MRSLTVNKNDAGQRLDKFLQKAVKALPWALLYKYIRLKRVKVNGHRAEISYILNENDVVDLYIGDEFFESAIDGVWQKLPPEIDVAYEDENIIVVNKPAGLVVHEDESGTADTLINRVKSYLFRKGEYDPARENSFAPALCHRLDRNTSGLVISAKNAEALRIMNQKIKSREVKKYYLCLVHGFLAEPAGTLTSYMFKDAREKKVSVSDRPKIGAARAVTKYKVVRRENDRSLVEVELVTGRTHQIRAQFAHLGHPLAGDGKYGKTAQNGKFERRYQALCAYKLVFDFSSDAGSLNYLKGKTIEIKGVTF